MKSNRYCIVLTYLFLLLCLMLCSFPAAAQEDDYVPYQPITKIDLGVSDLHLEAGESYTFSVTYEPADTVLTTLVWYVTDESVLSVDPLTNTVTALQDGEARIFAESIDEISYAVCSVTVGQSAAKDVTVMKSGDSYFGLTQKEQRKITAPTLVRYLDFVADSALDEDDFEVLAERFYDVLAIVKSGTEEAESERARSLGMESDPLPNLQSVTLDGNLGQILRFVKDNKNLVEITELGNIFIEDPDIEPVDEDLAEKAVKGRFNLQGNADYLSNITKLHGYGLKGAGRTIAVIDTGFSRNHEQFLDSSGRTRFIREACFSGSSKDVKYTYNTACNNNAKDNGNGASYPSKALRLKAFDHGNHVAGIAAGRDGVAPEAKIVAVMASSEKRWTCSAKELKYYRCRSNSNQCCSSTFLSSNQAKAFEYLIELAKGGLKIDAVNMSFGGNKANGEGYTGICDSTDKSRKRYFDRLLEAGILPVVSAGNSAFNNAVGAPACLSNAYTVAALANYKNPYIASYSNFNKSNIDMSAPGTNIYSAVLTGTNCTTGRNCYGYKNGTSMAAPMVTGSIALVRELYPGMSAEEAGIFLKEISAKSVSRRMSDENKVIHKFSFSKWVLDMRNTLTKFRIPDSGITASGQRVFVKFNQIKYTDTYQIRISDISVKPQRTVNARFRVLKAASITDPRTIEIDGKGNFQEGHVYRLEVTRLLGAKKDIVAKTVKYFRIFPTPNTLTAGSRSNAVDLNLYMPRGESKNHVLYRIYNADTNQFVKSIEATYDNRAQTVKGLNNGQKYYVTAQYYRDITVSKKSVRVFGAESKPVYFMPMNETFSCKYGVGKEDTQISCGKDPAADGIMVMYRSLDSAEVKNGCISNKGEFYCNIKDSTLMQSNTQFIIMKYKQDDRGWPWYSSSIVLNRPAQDVTVDKAEKLLVYFDTSKAVVSVSESKNANGITVLRRDEGNTGMFFNAFCDAASRSCSKELPAGESSFLVMRYRSSGGQTFYSSGVLTTNLWTSH
ncbi:MAG: S8 family serine peptidase [Anaerolineaceae bacterium]|nr:S8 family serine peptidase [Anaerolineaceae bacterium]